MIDKMLGGFLGGAMNSLRGNSFDRRQNGFPTPFTGKFVDENAVIRNEKQNHQNAGEVVIDTWTPVDADGNLKHLMMIHFFT